MTRAVETVLRDTKGGMENRSGVKNRAVRTIKHKTKVSAPILGCAGVAVHLHGVLGRGYSGDEEVVSL